MTFIDFLIRIIIAASVGAAVGLERQWNNKSAGLRTNTLVSFGACMFVIASVFATQNTGDPSRVIGQVVTGIGFLGAGVIFRQGVNVQGLTTAATLWCSAGLGSLAGLGFYLYSAVCAAFIILINISFKVSDNWIRNEHEVKKHNDKKYKSFE